MRGELHSNRQTPQLLIYGETYTARWDHFTLKQKFFGTALCTSFVQRSQNFMISLLNHAIFHVIHGYPWVESYPIPNDFFPGVSCCPGHLGLSENGVPQNASFSGKDKDETSTVGGLVSP